MLRGGRWVQHLQRLLGLPAVRVKAVGWELLYVRFAEASRLGVPQPLRQAQEGLRMGRRGGSAEAGARGPQATTSWDGVLWHLIVLHLHVIHVEVKADGGPHCCW